MDENRQNMARPQHRPGPLPDPGSGAHLPFAADAEPVGGGVRTTGETGETGDSDVTVKTEVRNNYTDTYERQTVTLVNGTATVADDLSSLDGKTLTFVGLGDLTVNAAYDGAKDATTVTVDTSNIQRQQEEQQ